MLKLNSLVIQNFGPFKGTQIIDFPEEDGVAIVYGENMRGKTSLLNAIRFAFFGKVMGRGSRSTALHRIGNWEQAAEGIYGFKIDLNFESQGSRYKLTRECRATVNDPQDDSDYVVEAYLEKDGDVLGPDPAKGELATILPEQVSRFFLFDGELLQEYEDLLSSESDVGRQISEAIERILGVPILTKARATAAILKEEAEKREAKAAQSDQRTQEYGNQLADIQRQRDALKEDLKNSMTDLEQYRHTKAQLEERLKRRERLASLMERRDGLAKQIDELGARLESKTGELSNGMSTAWCTLLESKAAHATELLLKEKSSIETSLTQMKLLAQIAAGSTNSCPTCMRQLDEGDRQKIEQLLSGHDTESIEEKEKRLSDVGSKLIALRAVIDTSENEALRIQWEALDEIQIGIAQKTASLSEIRKQLEDVDEAGLRKDKHNYDLSIRHIEITETAVARCEEALQEKAADADRIQKRLEQMAGGDVAKERERRQICADVHSLLDLAVSKYRDRLKEKVESDATDLFVELTTEPDYSGLRINENYGLNIVHRDGEEIPIRSAGAEHVVALCLVGALQRNAPLEGPIIIDSPFGRLDAEHTSNIVKALPTMAKQVMLLVYEEELPAELARNRLRGKLKSEWKLSRVSARHTELVRRRD